ncbi:Uncharacterised protein [Mycobacterium tuberculosis]|nr:Uncharacterised protein [Mycobacterium tuberculosis]
MIAPTYSLGTITDAFTNGSSTKSILPTSGNSDGFSMFSTVPLVCVTRNTTLGAVVMSGMLNSRSIRS